MKKLAADFYLQEDVVQLSRFLIGKFLFSNIQGFLTGGMIVETESYKGPEDRACHAHLNRRTKRTEVMFCEGGVAYVYLCYGMHSLLNVVTGKKDMPHAILIRAIEPVYGIETMLNRRKMSSLKTTLTSGPGSLTKSLGIKNIHNGETLTGEQIWIEDRGVSFLSNQLIASPRVGIDYAGEDAKLPWRFRLEKNKWTSPAKT
jgi:DNA-3-methyladenine glycosylase